MKQLLVFSLFFITLPFLIISCDREHVEPQPNPEGYNLIDGTYIYNDGVTDMKATLIDFTFHNAMKDVNSPEITSMHGDYVQMKGDDAEFQVVTTIGEVQVNQLIYLEQADVTHMLFKYEGKTYRMTKQ
ncbi:hypothetical protein [Flammeovirga kamogawensis]|uniref:Copper resistance protein NlpE n=1 Tax=Flammeovirga kamogawensis TaxID=373891 RepID=A0ABX8GWX3_9BACT|nr:hypothetical protein [Flammeovirga kamogawensis]MBB6461141.1 hypothetical protein [Flammeovirga kamogawensis]QWG07707.1 hypothetical protein KM029_01855 [Flammeovirga kamogawensis]TRX69515.1 hypothetical protein EO216_15790 [Flammeovirga kamogawensis]